MENITTENKKGFFQNDRKLVCSMLVFYGVCIIGVIALTFWWLNQRNQTISANATSTAYVIATQQANATATAIARLEEQNRYEFVERFDTSSEKWLHGPENDEYLIGLISIKDGIYVWDVYKVKKTFVYWSNFDDRYAIKDFDVYVDTKFVKGNTGDVCSGLIFRLSKDGFEQGTYVFSVCNSSFFSVYFRGEDGWDNISDWKYTDAIHPKDWNRLEVSARGENFKLRINNQEVYEMNDDRLENGAVGVYIEINEKNPATIWFDNFGLQNR